VTILLIVGMNETDELLYWKNVQPEPSHGLRMTQQLGKKITVTKTVKKNMARFRIAAVEQPTARNAPVARPYAHPTTSTRLQLRHPSS